MNKLYFRAWLKDEKRMVYAHSIDFSSPNPDNGEFREVGIWDVDGEFHEGFIGIHIDIMQGIEFDDNIVYEGDIVEDVNGEITEVETLCDLLILQRITKCKRVIGNICEGEKVNE